MLNKVVLIGRLVADPELRYTPASNATCSFKLACDRTFKNAQGEKETDFIPVTVPPFKKELAELCANYLSKGKIAAVDGSIRVRTYEKDGQKHWVTEVEAIDVRFLSPKNENTGSPAQTTQAQAQTAPVYTPPPYGSPPQQPYQQQPGSPTYPGYTAPPGYAPQQQPQGQWQGQPPVWGQQPPPPGYGQPPGYPPGQHPNMPNPNYPPNPPGAPPATGLYGHQVNISLDDDIPF